MACDVELQVIAIKHCFLHAAATRAVFSVMTNLNLTVQEHYGLYLRNQIFARYEICPSIQQLL